MQVEYILRCPFALYEGEWIYGHSRLFSELEKHVMILTSGLLYAPG